MWGPAAETGLRGDWIVSEDPVEHVEVAHLVVVGCADGHGGVVVVYLKHEQASIL